ncbi:hypothetical protein A4D02_06570 [Niastella koreensis]|uniref:Uncharacterized protein n=2 Tax=Niastella koreensis TaxID=354356 RepID=G8TG60_NIAKG|nr:hypothetical protein [Niastella koreensis]AEW01663.1 hypothetical protein Niako_5427 [Niastella koreensis GR20-10]OQP48374.1 hypothetical protein A4D02_06570 [Niastella koreensis]
MLRSNINTDRSDFDKIKDEIHVAKVWACIEKNIPVYFQKMIEVEDELAVLKVNGNFKVKASVGDLKKTLKAIFDDGFSHYKREDSKYQKFFSEESMHEFEDDDDPKTFKSALATKVPVILKARNSKRETMHEWQERFAHSKPADVYGIFFNLMGFMNEFEDGVDSSEFMKIDTLTELEKLTVLNNDDDYNVPGVIGMGIKSTVLYFLNPEFYLCANKNTLYGLYFLSDCENFSLPSGSNEFIMINDLKVESSRRNKVNYLIDQNYWYPYDLFILYGLRTYRLLKDLCARHKYMLDDENCFVHLNTFMAKIWDMKIDVIKTMTGGDQEDAR